MTVRPRIHSGLTTSPRNGGDGIEHGARLIHEAHVRLNSDRAGYPAMLLLTTGKAPA
jgi:hypothetical protein